MPYPGASTFPGSSLYPGTSSSSSSSSAVTVIAADDFSLADGSTWSGQWVEGVTPAAGSARILGGAGKLTTGDHGGYWGPDRVSRRLATVSIVDANVTGRAWFDGTDCFPQVFVRANDELDTKFGYSLAFQNDGQWFITKYPPSPGYTGSDLAAGTYPFTTGPWRYRFKVTGTTPTTLQVKLWQDGAAEPTAWLSVVIDSASPIVTPGRVGLTVGGGAGTGALGGGGAPTLTLSAVPESSAVAVSWVLSNATATSFTVGRDGVDSTGYGAWSTTDPATATSRQFNQLLNGTAYTFTVTANLTGGGTLTQTITATPVAVPTLSLSAAAGDAYATITWSLANTTAVSFTVGRDGVDNTGAGPWSTTDPATATTRTFDKLVNGTAYSFTVTANLPDGSTLIKTATATPAASSRRVPLAGFSGLGFNSTSFLPDTSASGANNFGTERNRPMDGLLFFTPRGSWTDLRYRPGDHAAYLAAGHIIVTTIPFAPSPEGTAMNGKAANNDYASDQQALGAYWASQGLNSNRHIVRIAWESNGNWYPWSNQNGGAIVWRDAFRRTVDNLRAGGLTQARFNCCWNKGGSQTGIDFAAFPGNSWCDVVSVDQYDQWEPSYNDGQWNSAINNTPGLQTVRDLAVANGIMWALDEGGNAHGSDGHHGNDNPFYWQKLWGFINDPNNLPYCAYHNTYNEPGDPGLHHEFSYNPNSYSEYRQASRWGGF